MYSKRRYKICIYSVILGGTWVFSKLQGLQYYFSENFRCNLKFYESENFSDSSLHRSFESRKFFFIPNPGCEMWKIKLQKIIGNFFRQSSKVVHEWNGHLEIFICPQVLENSRQYLLVRTGILQKTVAGCPWLKHQQVLSKNNIKTSISLLQGVSLPFLSPNLFSWYWNLPLRIQVNTWGVIYNSTI